MSPFLLAAVVFVVSVNGQPPAPPQLVIQVPDYSPVTWNVGDADRKFTYCMEPGVAGLNLVLFLNGVEMSRRNATQNSASYCMTNNFPNPLQDTYYAGVWDVKLIDPANNNDVIDSKQIIVNIPEPPTTAAPVTTTTPPQPPTLTVTEPTSSSVTWQVGDSGRHFRFCMTPGVPGLQLVVTKVGLSPNTPQSPTQNSAEYCVRFNFPNITNTYFDGAYNLELINPANNNTVMDSRQITVIIPAPPTTVAPATTTSQPQAPTLTVTEPASSTVTWQVGDSGRHFLFCMTPAVPGLQLVVTKVGLSPYTPQSPTQNADQYCVTFNFPNITNTYFAGAYKLEIINPTNNNDVMASKQIDVIIPAPPTAAPATTTAPPQAPTLTVTEPASSSVTWQVGDSGRHFLLCMTPAVPGFQIVVTKVGQSPYTPQSPTENAPEYCVTFNFPNITNTDLSGAYDIELINPANNNAVIASKQITVDIPAPPTTAAPITTTTPPQPPTLKVTEPASSSVTWQVGDSGRRFRFCMTPGVPGLLLVVTREGVSPYQYPTPTQNWPEYCVTFDFPNITNTYFAGAYSIELIDPANNSAVIDSKQITVNIPAPPTTTAAAAPTTAASPTTAAPPQTPTLNVTEPASSSVTWQVGDSGRYFRFCMTPGVPGFQFVVTKVGQSSYTPQSSTQNAAEYCVMFNFPNITSTDLAGEYNIELINPANNNATIASKQITVIIPAPATPPPQTPTLIVKEPTASSVTWQVGDSGRYFRLCMTPAVPGLQLVVTKVGLSPYTPQSPTQNAPEFCMMFNFPNITTTYFDGAYNLELIDPANNNFVIASKMINVTIPAPPTTAAPTTTTAPPTPPPTPVLSVNGTQAAAGATNTTVQYCMTPARPGFFLDLYKNGVQIYSNEAPGEYSVFCLQAILQLTETACNYEVRLLNGTDQIANEGFSLVYVSA